jgi:hypothetical protein
MEIVVALFGNPILEIVECLEQVSVLFGFKVTSACFSLVWTSILISDHVYGHVKIASSMNIIDTIVTYIYMLVSRSIRYVLIPLHTHLTSFNYI